MTLLKAYLSGSYGPFVLAKAFLEETLKNVPDIILKETKYNTTDWMDVFVESSRTIKDKPQMKATLRELLNEDNINQALNVNVIPGAGSGRSGSGQFRSGMANYDKQTKRTGEKTQRSEYKFKNPKLAQPAVRIQNLEKLWSLLEPFADEYPEQLQRIKEAIDTQIEYENTRESGVHTKSEAEQNLRGILSKLTNKSKSPLRRYRKGKYPHNFIVAVRQLQDLNLTPEALERISQGFTKQYDLLEESKHWFKEKFAVEFSDKTILEHILSAWEEKEEEQLDDDDIKLFKEAMYELIEEGGWKLESQKSRKHVTILKQAKNLLAQLERDFKAFRKLEEKEVDRDFDEAYDYYYGLIESMIITFTTLQDKFESLKREKNDKGKPLIDEDTMSDLENAIDNFNKAFEPYNMEVKRKTSTDKITWVKRIAEDAMSYTDREKSLKEALIDFDRQSGISIEGLDELESGEGMSREDMAKYVDARLPTIDKNNYRDIERVEGGQDKIKGFDEDAYNDALEAREETIDKIIHGKDIYRKDLLWILPKRKFTSDKTDSRLESELPKDDKYSDDNEVGAGIGREEL